MTEDDIRIGESFVGDGANAAHINVVLGTRAALGTAWSTALATPRTGHIPFVAILQPNVPVKPLTLFVNKAPIEHDRHGTLTWGAAQAGVALGVTSAVAAGTISAADADRLLLIAAVWVNPTADDERLVFDNNAAATENALVNAIGGLPAADDVVALMGRPFNPFYDPAAADAVVDLARGDR
jgi:5,6,7,8-tetrahydromethanopterin hydro-lyase